MATFRDWLTLHLAPPFLRKPWGTKYLGVVADALDTMASAAKEAVKLPFSDLCPNDALGYNGAMRNIERYTHDDDDSYRARISDPWGIWDFSGSSAGITDKIHAMGYTGQVQIWGWYQLQPDVAQAWQTWYSAFWVWMRFTGMNVDGLWSDPGNWDDTVPNVFVGGPDGPGTWDCNFTVYQVNELRATIRKWKSAHEICAGIRVLIGSDRWENHPGWDNGTWDDSVVVTLPG